MMYGPSIPTDECAFRRLLQHGQQGLGGFSSPSTHASPRASGLELMFSDSCRVVCTKSVVRNTSGGVESEGHAGEDVVPGTVMEYRRCSAGNGDGAWAL